MHAVELWCQNESRYGHAIIHAWFSTCKGYIPHKPTHMLQNILVVSRRQGILDNLINRNVLRDLLILWTVTLLCWAYALKTLIQFRAWKKCATFQFRCPYMSSRCIPLYSSSSMIIPIKDIQGKYVIRIEALTKPSAPGKQHDAFARAHKYSGTSRIIWTFSLSLNTYNFDDMESWTDRRTICVAECPFEPLQANVKIITPPTSTLECFVGNMIRVVVHF